MNNGKINVAIYARYSSDIQNPSSVDDQIKTCIETIKNNISNNANINVFSDIGISGASMVNRRGILDLIEAVKLNNINIVVAEGLDRISRSISDTAFIYDLMKFYDVKLFTIQEGYVSLIEASLKGIMNQLFLSDLGVKIRRGQVAKIEKGYFITPPPYGYRVRVSSDGRYRAKAGEREIIPEEALVIQRIFQEYANGRKLVQIVRDLNRDRIPSPRGSYWRVGALLCSKTGILKNNIYRGYLTYGKTKNTRNILTGKKKSVIKPENTWNFLASPEMRIVDDDLWAKVQNRISFGISKSKNDCKIDKNKKRHFTGYVKCGVCGSKKHVANKLRYVCCRGRYKASCNNLRGTEEIVISNYVFSCLKEYVSRNSKNIHSKFINNINNKIDDNKNAEGKISALLDCVDKGVDINFVSKKIIKIQEYMSTNPIPDNIDRYIGISHDDLSSHLSNIISSIESRYDIRDVRFMLECLVDDIVLTPVRGQYRGEDISVNIRDYMSDGWYKFLLSFACI